MMQTPRPYANFAEAFALAYEEERSGESYFAALSAAESDPRRAALWAKLALIERSTHTILRPTAEALGLTPNDPDAVIQSGTDEAARWKSLTWHEIIAEIIRDYPAYVTEFEQLKSLAPAEMKRSAQLLLDHEIAMIDFARAEQAGDPNPDAALDAYLAQLPGWTP